MSIAITGASGQLGRLAAEDLLSRTDADGVVLISRRPESLADFAARGVTVRAGDFDDPASLAGAFAGVDRLLLVSTDALGAARLEQQRAAVRAAAEAGVQRMVYTSVPEPVADNPALVVADHAGTEQALRESGLNWVSLRNNLYTDMLVPNIRQAAETGHYLSNSADGRIAYVTRADCAAAAAGALLADDLADGGYDVTGPQALTSADVAALASSIAGKTVQLDELDDAGYAGTLAGFGLPRELVDILVSFGASARGGYLATVSSTVEDLAGRAPTSVEQLLG